MSHELQADGRVHGVVFAVRREDGRWLMIRRSRQVALYPGKVCFPGGGAMEGESLEEAVKREAREELGVEIEPLRQVWRYEFADRPMTLFGYSAEIRSGEPRPEPLEIAEVLWLTRDEALGHADGLPTNRLFLDALDVG